MEPACTNAPKTECGCLRAGKLKTVAYVYPPRHRAIAKERKKRKVYLWSPDDEATGGLEVVDCRVVQVFLGDDARDHTLCNSKGLTCGPPTIKLQEGWRW